MDQTTSGITPGVAGDGGAKVVGILLIIVGLLAIFLPFVAGIAVTAVIGWLLLIGGAAHLFYAWHSRSSGAVVWQVIIGLLYWLVGLYLIFHPARGLVTLTLLLACYFVVEGILELVMYFRLRHFHRASWFLWDGLITLVLGLLIWAHWPFSSVWVLGTLVGISLLISGFTRLFFGSGRSILGGAAIV